VLHCVTPLSGDRHSPSSLTGRPETGTTEERQVEMTTKPVEVKVITLVSNKWWDSVQEDLTNAIADIDELQSAMSIIGKANWLVDYLNTEYIDAKLKKIRRILENIQTPL
jgi:GTP1/Obg family GTP-binding protein